MARIDRHKWPERTAHLLREYSLEVIKATALGARNIAHNAAEQSPVDTSRLLSNFLVGASPFDFTYRRAWVEGKNRSTRLISLARVGQFNTTRANREIKRVAARGRLPNRFRISVQNNTPYLPYVEERQPYLAVAVRSSLQRLQASYRSLRLRE